MATRRPDTTVYETASPARSGPTSRPGRGWGATVVRGVGELLLTAGVLLLLFVAYLLWWTGVETGAAQSRLGDDLGRAVAAAPAAPEPTGKAGQADAAGVDPAPREPALGAPYLKISTPRLGRDWSWVVVEGVGLPQLALGPGHYPASVGPGQVGNFAVAGHRSGHGEPFANLDRLRRGDQVTFSFGQRRWTYRVDRTFITDPSNGAVIAPVPGEPGVKPTKRLFTITTCNPRWGNSERLIITGTLQEGT